MATQNLVKIENVYFYYVKIAEPQKDVFDPEGLKKKFSVNIAVDKATAKEFKKLKLNKTVKEIDEATFLKQYKAIPDALKNDEDEYFIISFSANATYADGNPTPEWTWPKTYLTVNGKPVDSTKTLVGNGSFGDIRISTREGKTGINTALHSILVKDLVEYERRGDEWADAASGQAAAAEAEVDVPF